MKKDRVSLVLIVMLISGIMLVGSAAAGTCQKCDDKACGQSKCFGMNVYQCQNGLWLLSMLNSPECGYSAPSVCTDGQTKTVGVCPYQCSGNQWVLSGPCKAGRATLIYYEHFHVESTGKIVPLGNIDISAYSRIRVFIGEFIDASSPITVSISLAEEGELIGILDTFYLEPGQEGYSPPSRVYDVLSSQLFFSGRTSAITDDPVYVSIAIWGE